MLAAGGSDPTRLLLPIASRLVVADHRAAGCYRTINGFHCTLLRFGSRTQPSQPSEAEEAEEPPLAAVILRGGLCRDRGR